MNTEHIIQSVVCMLAIDGSIGEQERAFLQQLQRRLGVPSKVLQQALDLAKQGKGSVKLPEDPADQQRIFEVLVHAALADGTVTAQERHILDAVGAKIGLRKDLIEHSINFYAGEARKTSRKQSEGLPKAAASSSVPPPVPQSPPPVPHKPETMTCPKCGAEQELDRTDCVRCGIIFSRLAGTAETPEKPPRKPLYPEYDEDSGRAAEQLEQLQFISVLMNHAGSLVAIVAVILIVGFGVSQMSELGGYRYLIVLGLVLVVVLIIGHFTILNVAGVVTRGEVVNKWMRRDYNRRRNYRYRGTQHYTYHIEYVFQPGNDPSGKMRRGRASVNKNQYSRYRIGAPVKVRYLPGFSWIFRLEVW
jgi:hypothetical protein